MSNDLKEKYKDYPTSLPEYEYDKMKLKYLPPPPELEEGQVYMSKREFKSTVSQMYWAYFKENPLIPLGFATTLFCFGAGVRYSVKQMHDHATRMMLGVVGGQATALLAFRHAHNKKVAAREAQMSADKQEYMMDSNYK